MAPKNILPRKKIADFIDNLYDGDLHAKRVLSLANATLGVLVSASLAVHAIGQGDIYVTSAKGERRKAAQWVGQGGRSRTLRGAQVTDEHHLEVGRVVCVHDRKMKEPWCLVASESTVGTRTLIRYYGKRWGIETSFRDIKDMRFGMGLSARRVSSPQRRDRMLLLSALAIALLSLLGGAGESLGYDRWLKVNTAKYRTHSLFRQGLMLYDHIPNWSDERVCPLMERFSEMLMEQRVFKEIFGVI